MVIVCVCVSLSLCQIVDARPSEKDHVTVIERRSGQVLTGPSAPTEVQLELWLQTHPSYEVVLPGTTGATPPSSSSKCLGRAIIPLI